MTVKNFGARFLSISVLLTLLGSAPSVAAGLSSFSGKSLSGTIIAEIAGMSVVELDFHLTVQDGTYDLATSARSRGILDFFITFHSDVTSHGVFDGQHLTPLLYTLDGYSRGSDRSSRLDYAMDGTLIRIQTTPTPEEENREPIPPMAIENTLDPAAIFMKVLHLSMMDQGPSCILDRRVFDGYRLNHVYLQSIEQAGVEVSKAGLAEVAEYYDVETALPCVINGQLLFGRKLDEDQRPPDDTPAFIWFAHSKAVGLTVPAVFSKRTRFGTAIVRVFDLKIDDQVIQSTSTALTD